VLCSLPVRFDTYRGCGHACAYCFAGRKCRLTNIAGGEGVKALCEVGMAGVFKALCQDVISGPALQGMSYRDAMEIVRRVPVYREIMGLQTSGTGALRTGPTQHGRSGAGCGGGATRNAATRTGADRSESLVVNAMSQRFSGRPSRGGPPVARRRGTGIPRGTRSTE